MNRVMNDSSLNLPPSNGLRALFDFHVYFSSRDDVEDLSHC